MQDSSDALHLRSSSNSLIGQELPMLTVKDMMSRNVASVRGSATVAEAIQLMNDKNVRALVVERRTGERTVGIVTQDDIIHKVAVFGHNPQKMRVYQIMTRPCTTVQPDMGIADVAQLFAKTAMLCAPVVGDEPLGIISVDDIKTTLCVEQCGRVILRDRVKATGPETSKRSKARSNSSKTMQEERVPVFQ